MNARSTTLTQDPDGRLVHVLRKLRHELNDRPDIVSPTDPLSEDVLDQVLRIARERPSWKMPVMRLRSLHQIWQIRDSRSELSWSREPAAAAR
jgi:hypothetical protein